MAAIPAERLTGTGGLGVIAILGYMIPTISLLLGDQNMMQRFASAKSAEEAKKSNLGLFAAEITVCVLIILMCTIGIACSQAWTCRPTLFSHLRLIICHLCWAQSCWWPAWHSSLPRQFLSAERCHQCYI